ncbi:MAG TPA: hypothetical protein VD794_14670, partial [Flavisolibacter sp.]|nr:hypothetical protein [Flavisolibacter sp.]
HLKVGIAGISGDIKLKRPLLGFLERVYQLKNCIYGTVGHRNNFRLKLNTSKGFNKTETLY